MHEETVFDFTVNQDIITFIFIDFMAFSKHPVDSYAMLKCSKSFLICYVYQLFHMKSMIKLSQN